MSCLQADIIGTTRTETWSRSLFVEAYETCAWYMVKRIMMLGDPAAVVDVVDGLAACVYYRFLCQVHIYPFDQIRYCRVSLCKEKWCAWLGLQLVPTSDIGSDACSHSGYYLNIAWRDSNQGLWMTRACRASSPLDALASITQPFWKSRIQVKGSNERWEQIRNRHPH